MSMATFFQSHSVSIVFALLLFFFFFNHHASTSAKKTQCRTSCGQIQIDYPFGVDDGCGSPAFRHIFACTDSGQLNLRTPSGQYAIINISYTDSNILVYDPSTWRCHVPDQHRHPRAAAPSSLDTSTHLRLSPHNDYLFFNCSERDVIMGPKPGFCRRFPDQCDSICDTSSYLCRQLPECGPAMIGGFSCCSYYPKGSESLRMMLRHCGGYAGVYWRNVGSNAAYYQVPEYGIRVDFDIPVTATCLRCRMGGGSCGFDGETQEFLCLCEKGNVTTNCRDHSGQGSRRAVIAVSGVSAAGAFVGAGIWYLRKIRGKASVSHGVQTTENRLF